MDLTDRQRKLLFAGLVVVLAAAGVFLTIGGGGHRHTRASARRHADGEHDDAAGEPVLRR